MVPSMRAPPPKVPPMPLYAPDCWVRSTFRGAFQFFVHRIHSVNLYTKVKSAILIGIGLYHFFLTFFEFFSLFII